MKNKEATKLTLGITTLTAVDSPGPRTLRYEGRKTTASNRLRFHARPHDNLHDNFKWHLSLLFRKNFKIQRRSGNENVKKA